MQQFHCDVYPIITDQTKHEYDVDCGCAISDMIPEDQHAVVFVNERVLQPEEYDTCAPIEGDYVIIRKVPTFSVVAAAAAAIGSALAASAASAAFLAGSFWVAAGWPALPLRISTTGNCHDDA